jgi:hypothetical protein
MTETAAQIIERIFARARQDLAAAPLASAFANAYQDDDWTAEGLHCRVRARAAQGSDEADAER